MKKINLYLIQIVFVLVLCTSCSNKLSEISSDNVIMIDNSVDYGEMHNLVFKDYMLNYFDDSFSTFESVIIDSLNSNVLMLKDDYFNQIYDIKEMLKEYYPSLSWEFDKAYLDIESNIGKIFDRFTIVDDKEYVSFNLLMIKDNVNYDNTLKNLLNECYFSEYKPKMIEDFFLNISINDDLSLQLAKEVFFARKKLNETDYPNITFKMSVGSAFMDATGMMIGSAGFAFLGPGAPLVGIIVGICASVDYEYYILHIPPTW